ncbi:hypothetical protein HYDPIDRAFT_119347 [Hydnomerulius pinastri MD-312]|uniref:Uncharacterized protein n=1 Tax=Hydnomerulius pinastri MD-312 TaxID=994086 RepID=A0A0C9V0C6_9AGAM|nr:hypothetical protein HYDPIDRAFT_119347 [Hydnomerulius pinastri MD-312]
MSTISDVAEYIDVARVMQITRICQLVPCVVMFYDHSTSPFLREASGLADCCVQF